MPRFLRKPSHFPSYCGFESMKVLLIAFIWFTVYRLGVPADGGSAVSSNRSNKIEVRLSLFAIPCLLIFTS